MKPYSHSRMPHFHPRPIGDCQTNLDIRLTAAETKTPFPDHPCRGRHSTPMQAIGVSPAYLTTNLQNVSLPLPAAGGVQSPVSAQRLRSLASKDFESFAKRTNRRRRTSSSQGANGHGFSFSPAIPARGFD